MRTKPTLMFAASAFVVTAVLFTAAMVVASSLSIPDPAKRFLPPSARGLPSERTSEDLELANDNRVGQARTLDEPMPEVTAVPEPPSAVDTEPPDAATPDAEGRAVSSSGDTSTDVTGSPAPFAPSKGRAQDAPPSPYAGPAWPSWGDPTTPASREPRASESETPEPEPTDTPPIESTTEPPSESSTAEPVSSESEPASPESVAPSTQDTPSSPPLASEGASE
jgi:hypothetical protein